jgi:hypothetical protein
MQRLTKAINAIARNDEFVGIAFVSDYEYPYIIQPSHITFKYDWIQGVTPSFTSATARY